MSTTQYIVLKKDCPIRVSPSKDAKVYATGHKGAQYVYMGKTVNSSGNTWYKIDNRMWVYSGNATLKQKQNITASELASKDKDQQGSSSKLDYDIEHIVMNNTTKLESAIDGSTRMFGLPHQLTKKNDYRLSKKTQMGTMFTETFILDAPLIYLKPGTSNFLPGMSETQREAAVKAIINSAKDDPKGADIVKVLANLKDEDYRYFDFTGTYPEYMTTVNLLCRIGAVFLGINDLEVPWIAGKKITYGTYDWSGYKFSSLFQTDAKVKSDVNPKKDFTALVKDALTKILDDDDFVQFYVDANTSFSEGASNGTTTSMISQFTDQLESLGKELSFVSGVTGTKIDQVMTSSASTVDSAVSAIAKGDGSVATFLKRLTGVGKQVLSGANFLAPEIWSSSDYSKSYSFTVTLATPYGNKEAWYLNIFVPMMHLLAMAIPKQLAANTYTAPFLVRAFSPGWFTCDLGIIDSISIEKGGSGDSWSSAGLPNEVKITMSIKDLYSNLALPYDYSFKSFFGNTGLINFLMVNCGCDITKQSMDDKVAVFMNLFMNNLKDVLKETVYSKVSSFRESVRSVFNLFQ